MADLSTYETTFALIDADGDGRITSAELKSLVEKLGGAPDAETLAALVAAVDSDHNGSISREELAGYLEKAEG